MEQIGIWNGGTITILGALQINKSWDIRTIDNDTVTNYSVQPIENHQDLTVERGNFSVTLDSEQPIENHQEFSVERGHFSVTLDISSTFALSTSNFSLIPFSIVQKGNKLVSQGERENYVIYDVDATTKSKVIGSSNEIAILDETPQTINFEWDSIDDGYLLHVRGKKDKLFLVKQSPNMGLRTSSAVGDTGAHFLIGYNQGDDRGNRWLYV